MMVVDPVGLEEFETEGMDMDEDLPDRFNKGLILGRHLVHLNHHRLHFTVSIVHPLL